MRALIKTSPSPGVTLAEVEVPTIGPEDVLVKIKATSVCGTDLHIYHWNSWAASRMKTPIIVGHECSGEVVEIGKNVKNVKVGAHVSIETHIACGKCLQCQTNRQHLCQNVRLVGVDRPGAFAEFLSLPARNVWVNDSELPWEIASILEPFGNAVHSITAVGGVKGKSVLVSGCGPIGIMGISAARAMGALQIFATDVNDYRLDLAKRMKPDSTINAKKVNAFEAVMEMTRGNGIDILLEMSGAASAIDIGFRLLKSGGSAGLLGLPSGPIQVDLTDRVILKGIKVYGIFGREMFKTWEQVHELITSGSVDLSKVITHKFSLNEFSKAMDLLESGQSGKVVFTV